MVRTATAKERTRAADIGKELKTGGESEKCF